MAEAITIPSPSVFLRASPEPAPSSPPQTTQHVRRQSADAKKKATRKRSAGAGGASSDRPKQSKSRNGCVTCKAKRLKCDEEKPACQQCKKRNVECGGYKKDFKWRPFEETNVKVNIDRQKRASPPAQASANSSKPTTPPSESAPTQENARTNNSSSPRESKRPNVADHDDASTPLPQRPAKAKRMSKVRAQENVKVSPVNEQPEPSQSPAQDEQSREESHGTAAALQAPDEQPHPVANPSPTLTELLLPFTEELSNGRDLLNFSVPDGVEYPLSPEGDPAVDGSFTNEDDNGDVEEIVRLGRPNENLQLFISSRRPTPSSSGSVVSPEDVSAAWQGPVNYLYSQPYFSQDSPEMLTFRFDKLTCGILSVMDGPTENPWRTSIWPLAQQSPALYHAIIAMTAFHSSTDVPILRLVGHEHKQASIRHIQAGIRDSSMTDQTAIATALALGFSESWDQHTVCGDTHIRGAQALVKRAMANHQRNPLTGMELARLKFLCNAWVYMDVIARLTAVDCDESNDFDNAFLFSSDAPDMVMGDCGPPGFGIDFGMPIDARLDPLMGCASTLFPLIGRVANLVRKVCRSKTNSPAVISQANDLKLALETWDPPAFIERPEDPTTDVQHTLQTAEAYRWATLLHLHQSVPELPSMASAELAQRVLQYLATVPLASRTVIVQIYPLMVAGCEATTTEDRQWVRDRWMAMGQRMRIGIIDKSATVTEEVWRRRDAYEAQPTTRRKLVATSDLHPIRQRGAPLVKTPTGFQSADPGHTGMVFSYVEADIDPTQQGGSSPNDRRPSLRNIPDRAVGAMDAAYTVRGHLHWVGVMWDWGWEVLLG